MFTGLVQYVFDIDPMTGHHVIVLRVSDEFVAHVNTGDSVCIDGVCLTVVEITGNLCKFDLSNETSKVTTFGRSNERRTRVNVELAMKYGDRVGGHYVLGHVHECNQVISNRDGVLRIKVNPHHVQHKGSIAVNGVSLTIADVQDDIISIYVIPETFKRTTLSELQSGDYVNIEYDLENHSKSQMSNMEIAIVEGEKGLTTTSPNPHVGCVIVAKNGSRVSGYHHAPGEKHAEIVTMDKARSIDLDLVGATMYVTLEPCCHYGRTPPCISAIIESGISKVIVGILDCDPRVSGKGIDSLRAAGIEVQMADDSERKKVEYSLRSYLYQRKTKLPYVTVKVALTADGCYRGGSQRWITHRESRELLYEMWNEQDALVIGARTVLKDNPVLDTDDYGHSSKARTRFRFKKVIFDGSELQPGCAILLDDPTTILVTSELQKWPNNPTIYVDNIKDKSQLRSILSSIGGLRVMIEGGAVLQRHFMNAGLVNEIIIFRGSKIHGPSGVRWDPPGIPVSLVETKFLNCDGEYNIMERYLVTQTIEPAPISQTFNDVQNAIVHFARGGSLVVMDSESRENEGDLIAPGPKMTLNQMIDMINDTSGIICLPMDHAWAKKLDLQLITNNTDRNCTPFTSSIDFVGVHTGISAQDRLATVRAVCNLDVKSADFTKPGHMFPLVARAGLLNERQGHTEAGVTLCELAGVYPRVAVIGELKNIDGTIKNRMDCFEYASRNRIPIINIDQLKAAYNLANGPLELAECDLSCESGLWQMILFDSGVPQHPHKVLMTRGNKLGPQPAVRIHSECFTGDVLGSKHCDCGQQLKIARNELATHRDGGIMIFPAMQEGRGIGLIDKIRAYKIQANGIDTYSANKRLGHCEDARTYIIVGRILRKLNINRITLLTENLGKINELRQYIEVEPHSLRVEPTMENAFYLETKLKRNATRPGAITEEETKEQKMNTAVMQKYGDLNNKTIALVSATWHSEYIGQICNILRETIINSCEVPPRIIEITAPGSHEVPFAASRLATAPHAPDGIICIGILLKGDTLHFENVSNAVAAGIMQAQIITGVPMMNCILSCYTLEQIIERISGAKSTLPYIAYSLLQFVA